MRRQALSHTNAVRDLWRRCTRWPFGTRIFSALLSHQIPYTGTIGAHVLALRHGASEVRLFDRRRVRNHLRSIHAIALANLAEYAGNLALAYGLPPDARFIVRELSMTYEKKARGTILARGSCDCPTTSAKADIPVIVEMFDTTGERVATAKVLTRVGPKR